MNSLHVTDYGVFIGKHSERLVLRRGKEVISEHPLMDLEQVLIDRRAGGISCEAIEECCRRGIPLTMLGRGGQPIARLVSPALTATVRTRRHQLAAFLDGRGVALARAFAAGKLQNQANLLRYFGKYRKTADPDTFAALSKAAAGIAALRAEIERLDAPDVDTVRASLLNLEGRAGALYWSGVKALLGDRLPFAGREHCGAGDPFNAMLNYGYGILQSQVWTAVTLAGLEPFAGYIHVDRPGKPSLILDLMEEFRQPAVDRPLLAAIGKGFKVEMETDGSDPVGAGLVPALSAPDEARAFLTVESRRAVAARVLERLEAREPYEGKRHSLKSIIQLQARHLAVAVRGEAPYQAFVTRW